MRKLKLQELNRVSVQEFKRQVKNPIVIVLDNVRSALNVGSAFRTSDAFALEKIYLCGITATPPHREILKTAIGATESVDWIYEKTTIDALATLKKEGYTLIAIEQAEGSIALQNFDIQTDTKYALIFGNEVSGVSEAVMQVVDFCIEIPQYGTKHSLNISGCAGSVIWAIFRNIKFPA